MFTGGIADKLGNRYESKWLVRQLFRVLYSEYNWLHFEGLTTDFEGFEFALGNDTSVQWHQTKVAAPNGNWTINALKTEGVLDAFRKRFASTETDTCYFISEEPAKDAKTLAQKSRNTNTIVEFEQNLSQKQSTAFTDLSAAWETDKKTAWEWLQRSFFQVETTPELDSQIHAWGQLAFESGNGPEVYALLRNYMEEHFNKEISTEKLRQDLNELPNLKLKDWALDPTLKERLFKETQSYLNTYSPFGAGGEVIVRKEAQQVFDSLFDPKAPRTALITGIAGSGKSGVVRRLINLLAEAGIPHLAFRADHHLGCSRPEDFGQAILQRNEQPTVTLKGIAQDQMSVLIIDQVDAISEVSGRDGTVRNALLQLLDGLYGLRTVRVVLVCRNYDFDSDPRLKVLRDEQYENRFDIGLLDWETEIIPIISAKGYRPEHFSPAQQELLKLPLNLSVYLEIAEHSLSFASRDDLFRALIRKKQKMLRQNHGVTWSLMQVMETLAEWMSVRQRLEAPENILDHFLGAQDILLSEGMIINNRGHVNFFHESFFDYAYAQGFARSDKSLHEMLISTEQHLFRRTQCRQILEVMRQQDFTRYLETLTEVLLNEDVRYHVKLAISMWLGTLREPSLQERDIILKIDNPNEAFTNLVEKAFFHSAEWFDLHVNDGWLQRLMCDTNEQRQHTAFWSIVNVASDRPSQTAKILRDWWGDNPDRANILFGWLGSFRRAEPHRELEQLCVDIIYSKPSDLFSEKSQHKREMMLVTWVEESSGQGAPLLKAYFDTWFDLHPDDHPFHTDTVGRIDLHSIGKLCQNSPASFIEATIDAFVRSLVIIRQKKEQNGWERTFATRTYSGHMMGDDEFLQLLRSALNSVAESNPNQALEFLSKIPPDLHEVCLHIHFNTILGNPEGLKNHFMQLQDVAGLFECGWEGAEWKSYADATAAVFPLLSHDEKIRVEKIIFAQRPEHKQALEINKVIRSKGEDGYYYTRAHVIHYLNESGFEQWCVLKTIGFEHLSSNGRVHFNILDRKFPKRTLPEPRNNEASWVSSPIKTEKAKFMTDKDWLKAINRYDNERSNFPRSLNGGSHELSQVLKQCVKDDPARFVDLMSQIPESAPNNYIVSILWAIYENGDTPDNIARAAVLNAHERIGNPFGEDIARIIAGKPNLVCEEDIFKILMFYAEYGEAEEDIKNEQHLIEREKYTIKDLMDHGRSFRFCSTNGARGQATEALENVLWNVPERVDEIQRFIERRVVVEPLVSIRCSLTGPLNPLYNRDRKTCGQMLEKLVSAYSDEGSILPAPNSNELTPLITQNGIKLMPYLLYGAPDEARNMLDRLRKSDNEMMQMLAAYHILRSSFEYKEFIMEADEIIAAGGAYRVLAADITANMISVAQYQDRVFDLLVLFFNDPEEEVRKKASTVFFKEFPKETKQIDKLLSTYLSSPAFDGADYGFYNFLKKTDVPIVEYVIQAAELLVEQFATDNSGKKVYRDFHHLHELLRIEYTASEHNADLRRRLLDIIDICLQQGIYGTDEILKSHDRAA